jgi:thiol-disulfide isomerase/thioredoxin
MVSSDGYTIGVYDFEGIKSIFEPKGDITYVINFWATWCKPCIKELPYFERIHREYGDQDVRVILVSLDMRRQVESSLIPFIKSNDITSDVLLLDDPDANKWIGQIDENWSGSIPATLFINKNNRLFLEQEFEYEELKKTIQSII